MIMKNRLSSSIYHTYCMFLCLAQLWINEILDATIQQFLNQSCLIPSMPSDTFMSDPRPTYTHNSNVIVFCPKCQCKWKCSQKWSFEKADCHLAVACDPRWYQILTFAAIIFPFYSHCEDILCMQSLYTHKDIFAIVQGRTMKQIPELSGAERWKWFHDAEAEGVVTGKWDFCSQPLTFDPEQFVWINKCNSSVKVIIIADAFLN